MCSPGEVAHGVRFFAAKFSYRIKVPSSFLASQAGRKCLVFAVCAVDVDVIQIPPNVMKIYQFGFGFLTFHLSQLGVLPGQDYL